MIQKINIMFYTDLLRQLSLDTNTPIVQKITLSLKDIKNGKVKIKGKNLFCIVNGTVYSIVRRPIKEKGLVFCDRFSDIYFLDEDIESIWYERLRNHHKHFGLIDPPIKRQKVLVDSDTNGSVKYYKYIEEIYYNGNWYSR